MTHPTPRNGKFLSVSTATELRSTRALDGTIACAIGLNRRDDGFGAFYVADSRSGLPDDGSTTFITAMAPNQVEPRWRKIATASDFTQKGAVSVSAQRAPYDEDDNRAFETACQKAQELGLDVEFEPGKGSAKDGAYIIGVVGQNVDRNTSGNIDYSNLTIRGSRQGGSVIRKKYQYPYIFFNNPVGYGSHDKPDEQSGVYRNLAIHDLTFVDDVEKEGFAEFECLIFFSAVEDVAVTNCRFIGWRGDAIHLGAGDLGGGPQNRHNRRVLIEDCVFDGVNKNNRQAVSVVDGEEITIRNCWVFNATKPGDSTKPLDYMNPLSGMPMPGAIDFEPNTQFTKNPICRNNVVDGLYVDNCGGSALAYFLGTDNSPANLVTPMTNFLARNIFARRCLLGLVQAAGDENAAVPFDIRIDGGQTHDCGKSFQIIGTHTISIENFTFNDSATCASVGYINTIVRNFSLKKSVFRGCGKGGGGALQVRGGDHHTYENVLFLDNDTIGMSFVTSLPFTNGTMKSVGFSNSGAGPNMTTSIGVFEWAGASNVSAPFMSNIVLNGIGTYNFSTKGGNGAILSPDPQPASVTPVLVKGEYQSSPEPEPAPVPVEPTPEPAPTPTPAPVENESQSKGFPIALIGVAAAVLAVVAYFVS